MSNTSNTAAGSQRAGFASVLEKEGTHLGVTHSDVPHLSEGIGQHEQPMQSLARQTHEWQMLLCLLDVANGFICDKDDRITRWTSGCERLYGYSSEQALGQISYDLLRTESFEPLDQIRQTLLKSDRWKGELIHTGRDGQRVVVASTWMLHRDDTGTPIATLEINDDLTEQKRAEEQLRKSEQRFHKIFEEGPLGMGVVDLEHRIVQVNATFCEMVGYSQVELIGQRFEDITHPDDVKPYVELLGRMARGEIPYFQLEKQYVRKDGGIVPVLLTVSILRYASGEPKGFLGMMEDITRPKQVEMLLARREREFRTLVENAPDIIERFDPQFRLLYVNPILGKITGIPTTAFIGKTKRELGMPLALCDLWEAKLTDVFSRGQETGFEFDYLAPHGLMHLYARLVPEAAPDGSVESALSIVRDITAQKQAEIAMRHAKEEAEAAGRAKDQFIAVLSHELRTPLTPVLTTVQVMEADATLSPEQQESVSMIRRNVELEARLIDDLLDLTRISRGKVELYVTPVDLRAALRHTIQICESEVHSKQLRLTVELNATNHQVQADTARLQQILWNLLKNAVKFTPPGGEISIRTAHPRQDWISLTIKDTGIGIEPDLLPRLFSAFEQGGRHVTKQFGGLGLGLTISKELVDLHGGTLTASSEGKGHGATFTMELPTSLIVEGERPRHDLNVDRQPKAIARRILLVEDHVDTAKVMARVLTGYGFEVNIADSVASAVRLAQATDFDLLISDIGLPDGSGHDLMRQVRAKRPVKGIVLSGFGMEEDIRKSKEAGFAHHLTKPVNLQKLKEVIGQVLDS